MRVILALYNKVGPKRRWRQVACISKQGKELWRVKRVRPNGTIDELRAYDNGWILRKVTTRTIQQSGEVETFSRGWKRLMKTANPDEAHRRLLAALSKA